MDLSHAVDVPIKLLGDAAVPKYESPGACGFDFAAAADVTIAPKSLGLVPTGCVIKVPSGYVLLVGSRSSTAKKFGLLTPHGFGVIDQDYHGDTDQVFLQFYNYTDHDANVKKGDRVGQGFFVRCDQAHFAPTTGSLRDGSRGGFGSTGR
jgi:dUTP pyrophosphatase